MTLLTNIPAQLVPVVVSSSALQAPYDDSKAVTPYNDSKAVAPYSHPRHPRAALRFRATYCREANLLTSLA
ncbi:MAG: hypothetical protein WCP35_06755 [Verrucomicrobiota bacterium]